MAMVNDNKKIVVIGGGYAGVSTARQLAKASENFDQDYVLVLSKGIACGL